MQGLKGLFITPSASFYVLTGPVAMAGGHGQAPYAWTMDLPDLR